MRNILLLIIILFVNCSETKNDSKQAVINSLTNWKELNHKDSIPHLFRMVLIQINNGEFEIANPNENYNATDVVEDSLPSRKLTLLATRNNEWRIGYTVGGFAKHYEYAECRIYGDSLSELKIGNSLLTLDNNDSINKYLSQGKLELKSIRVVQE